MKLTIILIACAAMLSACDTPQPANPAFITYEGWPLTPNGHVQQVHIPSPLEYLYSTGDTVWIDTNGAINDFPIRDAETGQPVIINGLQQVVLKPLSHE